MSRTALVVALSLWSGCAALAVNTNLPPVTVQPLLVNRDTYVIVGPMSSAAFAMSNGIPTVTQWQGSNTVFRNAITGLRGSTNALASRIYILERCTNLAATVAWIESQGYYRGSITMTNTENVITTATTNQWLAIGAGPWPAPSLMLTGSGMLREDAGSGYLSGAGTPGSYAALENGGYVLRLLANGLVDLKPSILYGQATFTNAVYRGTTNAFPDIVFGTPSGPSAAAVLTNDVRRLDWSSAAKVLVPGGAPTDPNQAMAAGDYDQDFDGTVDEAEYSAIAGGAGYADYAGNAVSASNADNAANASAFDNLPSSDFVKVDGAGFLAALLATTTNAPVSTYTLKVKVAGGVTNLAWFADASGTNGAAGGLGLSNWTVEEVGAYGDMMWAWDMTPRFYWRYNGDLDMNGHTISNGLFAGTVPTTAYGSGWDGSAAPASRDAVYDKIATLPTTNTPAFSGLSTKYAYIGIQQLGQKTSGTTTVDPRNGAYLKAMIGGAFTLALTNAMANTYASEAWLELTHTNNTTAYQLSLASAIRKPGGVTPVNSASSLAVDLYHFIWNGSAWSLNNFTKGQQ